MTDKIQQDLYQPMNNLAQILKELLKPYGFALLVFPTNTDDGRMNYISSARREDMIVAMKEFIARNEGNFHDQPKGVLNA